jgi:sec-independent protein translocase protein TatB
LRSEFGEDVDWASLDPRQYDPRKIVRDALFDDSDATPAAGTAAVAAVATGAVGTADLAGPVAPMVVGSRRDRRSSSDEHETVEAVAGAPFDDEAT